MITEIPGLMAGDFLAKGFWGSLLKSCLIGLGNFNTLM